MNHVHLNISNKTLGTQERNDPKPGKGVDKALSCLGDLLRPMSALGDIGSYKCHFEMNLETAEND